MTWSWYIWINIFRIIGEHRPLWDVWKKYFVELKNLKWSRLNGTLTLGVLLLGVLNKSTSGGGSFQVSRYWSSSQELLKIPVCLQCSSLECFYVSYWQRESNKSCVKNVLASGIEIIIIKVTFSMKNRKRKCCIKRASSHLIWVCHHDCYSHTLQLTSHSVWKSMRCNSCASLILKDLIICDYICGLNNNPKWTLPLSLILLFCSPNIPIIFKSISATSSFFSF